MGKKRLKRKIAKLEAKVRKLEARLRGCVELPVDRNKNVIEPKDTLAWDDGSTIKVAAMTFYGLDFESIGCWDVAGEDEDDYADNLAWSLNVTKMMQEGNDGR